MKSNSKQELINDFNKMISSIDFKNYNPTSPDFMSALFIGMMWKLLSDIPEQEEPTDEIEDEIEGAEKYIEMWIDTSDSQYKQMATDELRHAKILINKRMSKSITEDEKELLEHYEKNRNSLSEKLM